MVEVGNSTLRFTRNLTGKLKRCLFHYDVKDECTKIKSKNLLLPQYYRSKVKCMLWCYIFTVRQMLLFSPTTCSAKMNARTKIARASCAFALPCYDVKRTHIKIKLTRFFCSFQFERNEMLLFLIPFHLFGITTGYWQISWRAKINQSEQEHRHAESGCFAFSVAKFKRTHICSMILACFLFTFCLNIITFLVFYSLSFIP